MDKIITEILEKLEVRLYGKPLLLTMAQETIRAYGPEIIRESGWKLPTKHPEVDTDVVLYLPGPKFVSGFWDGENWATMEGEIVKPIKWIAFP